jgi:hypothetical protein
MEPHKFQNFASVACDILWFYRNKAFYDGISFDARSVSAHVNKISLEHFSAWHSKLQVPVEKWIPPLNWVKINFDIAIRDSFSVQAVVCCNSEGQIIHMLSQISPSCSPNVGETLAAQLAIFLAASLLLDRFILKGDSKVVVLALQHLDSPLDWRISLIIFDSLDAIHFASSWEVRKINRSANFYAYSMAR